MTYQLEGNTMLFAIERTRIADIAVGDTIQLNGLPGADYQWTEHDSALVENNPDDHIFLEIERTETNLYHAKGIVLQEFDTLNRP